MNQTVSSKENKTFGRLFTSDRSGLPTREKTILLPIDTHTWYQIAHNLQSMNSETKPMSN